MSEQKNRKPLLLVMDGHAMVFRAWHAMKDHPLRNSKGRDTRGAHGFLNMFLKVVEDHPPTHVALTLDTRAPTFRDELFPQYKAHRPPVDPEIHEQIPMVKSIMQAFKIPVLEYDGFEADDLVGTLSTRAENEGIETLIVTSDADQLQLVSPNVRLLMYTGYRETPVYDVEAVKKRYEGLGPEYVPDIKALEGDKSDNIPGVPGVGEKAARAVLSNLGRLDQVYEQLDQVPDIKGLRGAKRVRNLLEEHRQTAFEGKVLTTIVRDVPVEFDFKDAEFWNYDYDQVVKTLRDLEFRRIIERVPYPAASYRQHESEQLALEDAVVTDYRTVTTSEELQVMVAELSTPGGFAFDTETTGKDPVRSELVGLSFSNSAGKAWYVPVGHNEGEQIDLSHALAVLRPLFEDEAVPKTAHNANYDLMVLEEVGIQAKGVDFDTMIAAALTGRRAIGLKQLVLDSFQVEMTPITDLIGKGRKQITMAETSVEQAADYAAADADMTWRLREHLTPHIESENQQAVMNEIEMPLLPVIVRMQRNGILIDRSALAEMSGELGSELASIENHARNEVMAGREFNLNSNRQLAEILIDELGAPKTRKTKTGYVMDANALDRMLQIEDLDNRAYELVKDVLRFREHSKLKSTYVDALPLMINPRTGRVHTSFNQVGSATGRLSSSDPNVQNIPVRTELGRRVRSAFVADHENGWTLLAADYSQIELRILAHMSEEPGLLASFRAGEDIHDATARAMYGTEEVTSEQRRIAKILNFGVIYGLGPHGVAMQTDLTRAQGKEFIELYFGKYPGIRDYVDSMKEDARRKEYAQTLSGRRRWLRDLVYGAGAQRAAAERMAINMPIQGTAADIAKIAMINIDKDMADRRLRSRMCIQVHDELIFEVAPGEMDEMTGLVTTLMPAAMDLSVPLNVEVKSGDSWGHMD